MSDKIKYAGCRTHGMCGTRIYEIWHGMMCRCYSNNKYSLKTYKLRGIVVCEKWKTFEGFYEDMKYGYADNLSLDRIDVNGNYEPGNCRWATRHQQSWNRQDTIYITHDGITQNVCMWAAQTGLQEQIIRYRFHAGWTPEQILTIKPRTRQVNRPKKYNMNY